MISLTEEHMHPWHDVPVGVDIRDSFTAIIEVPKGSSNKYELEKRTGILKLDRVLYSAVYYPANYGFIPQSLGGDGDPLDVLVLMDQPVPPLCLLHARAIGALPMVDEAGMDEKIIAVCVHDPAFSHYHDMDDIPHHQARQIERFFLDYKALENKQVETMEYLNRKRAWEVIQQSIERYQLYRAEKGRAWDSVVD